MNPFDESKRSYIIAGFTTAMIYAFTIGNQALLHRIIDGLVYGGLLCFAGIMLWYIFRFASPRYYTSSYQLVFLISLAFLTCLIIVGIETLAMYICFPAVFRSFITTIPARVFVTFLFFTIIRLFYILNWNKQEISMGNNEDEKKQPAPVAAQLTDRITVRSGQKIRIIPTNEIMYIQAEGDYISIHTTEGKWLKEQTMKFMETLLPPENFVRIHRSYIINVNYISRIERYGERQQVVLHNHEKIKISIARYQSLKQRLGI